MPLNTCRIDGAALRNLLFAAYLIAAAVPVRAQDNTSQADAAQPAAVGETVPDFEFPDLVGHDGRTRLSELRGQPVLIAGFRQHLADGLHAAWVANELFREHADDGLVVVVIDTVAWSDGTWAAKQSFWLRCLGSRLWLASGSPESPDLPIARTNSKRDEFSLVLIGVDGKLVCEGSAELASAATTPNDHRTAIKSAVAAELKRLKTGWGGSDSVRRARASAFGKGDFAGALRILRAAGADAEDADAELAEVQDEIDRAFRIGLERIRRLVGLGRFVDAGPARGARAVWQHGARPGHGGCASGHRIQFRNRCGQ
jgi:hypothetical protein